MHNYYKRLVTFLGSRTFFALTLVLFIFSALWLAVSARYPMAFDENYHLGLIKLHALQWNPIFTHQPAGVAEYGALTRDPSYIYHYLISFPYRLFTHLKMNDIQIILALRFINVALFSASLILFRKILLKTRASPAIIHCALFFFILAPVVPFLAATINYDNLQNLLLAWSLLLLLRFREAALKKKFDITAFVGVCSIGLLGSLVKFTFLPFLTAFAVYFLYVLFRNRRGAAKAVQKSWRAMSTPKKIIVSVIFLFSVGLFVNTYAVNLVKYHNPVPQCGQVLDYQRCSAYSPWYRNYLSAISSKKVNPNPFLYSGQWIGGMFDRLFFVINGKAPVDNYQNFLAPIMASAAILLGVFGIILTCRYGKKILQADPVLSLLLFVSLIYVASVWGRNYHDYLHLKQGVAINGRYLIPILPFVYILVTEAYQQYLIGQAKAKAMLFSISLLLMLQGGSITSFIYYSSDSWYWDKNTDVQRLNHAAKRVVDPFFVTHYFKTLDHIYQ